MAKKNKKAQNYSPPMIAELINEDHLEIAGSLIKALAHPLRLQILHYIDQNPSTNVNGIYNSLGLEQSITSQHLRVLRVAELVNSSRSGKEILYSVNHPRVKTIKDAVTQL